MNSPTPPPSPATPHDRACAVPLVELLRAVPHDARYTYTETDGVKATHFIPIGRYAHEAAELIASLQSRLAEVERDAARYRYCQLHGWPVRNQTGTPDKLWIAHNSYSGDLYFGATPSFAIDSALSAASVDGDKGEGK